MKTILNSDVSGEDNEDDGSEQAITAGFGDRRLRISIVFHNN